jgi:hypothetical protein
MILRWQTAILLIVLYCHLIVGQRSHISTTSKIGNAHLKQPKIHSEVSSNSEQYHGKALNLTLKPILVDSNYSCLISNVSRYDNEPFGYRNYRIVVTSTTGYFPIFLNWLHQYYRFCPNTEFLFFVCFDKEVAAKLEKYHLACNYTHYIPTVGGHQRIWLIRGLVVRKLITAGYDVLLADSDALWLRNPFSVLSQFPTADIIASRASYPEDIYERLGATVCMGFVYFQSNVGTIALWSAVTDELTKHRQPDDQRIFNHVLMKMGLYFSRKLNYKTNKVHDIGSIETKTYVYNVTMLSHALFRRVCDINFKNATRNSIVAHCSTSGKDLATKMQAEKNFNLWYLHPKWEDVNVANMTMSETLQSIATQYH